MAVDPAIHAFLLSPLARPPPCSELGAEGLRALLRQYPAPRLTPPVLAVRDLKLQGAGGDLTVRLYTPSAAPNLPLIVYFHGGGFTICTLEMYDDLCRTLANVSGCAVASVDYRLAPETPFPGAAEDCYLALRSLATQAQALGLDPTRVAVAGDSAGANLATVTALLAREREGPALRYQALIYPCVDPACASASQREFASGYMLTRESMLWYWAQYLQSPTDAANPLAAPARADLRGLPAATLITAEFDPLRDEGEDYANRLQAAGVPVLGRRYLGMIHGFVSMPYLTGMANRALADVAADIRAALAA
jgi:acetyl esterase